MNCVHGRAAFCPHCLGMSCSPASTRETHTASDAKGTSRLALTLCGSYLSRAAMVPFGQSTCMVCYPRTVVVKPRSIDG